MTFAVFVSFCLVVCGLAVCAQGGRSKTLSSLVVVEALTCVLLLIGYAAANYFTGEGINSAVWYHLWYGLRGAGFQDYRSVIIVGTIALIIAPLSVVGAAWWRRNRPRRVSLQIVGQLLLISALLINPGSKDVIALVQTHSPATADFFRHLQPAGLTSIGSDHASFIYIYAESLERSYFDERRFPGLITHLRELERRGTSFTNIQTVEGTGFTMGGIVASLCGIPLFTPAHGNSMSGMDAFLPGVTGLSDLLHDQGYFLSFMGGASLDFAGKRKFLATHHFDESAGFQELHGRTRDRAYINNWGLYDDTLFDFAYDRVIQLANQGRPFGFFMLTLDTHHPDGHVSKSVSSGSYGDGTNPMLNAVKGSDELIARFVHRVWASPQGKDTVIVIASDHLAMMNAASNLLQQGERRNLFLVLDPRNPTGAQVSRLGSTLDIGVTLLPTLGFKGRINLGRDLRDPASSESEIVHIQKKDTLLSWRSDIIRFWDFPRFKDSFSFDPKSALVKIDNRQFQAPVLVELAGDGRTTLHFEFDATYDVRLAEQATKLAPGTQYLLVAKTKDAQILLTAQTEKLQPPWVLIAGRAGEGSTTVPLVNESTFSKKQVDELLTRSTAAPVRSTALSAK